jgi:RNA polymerase-binding transcription factor DksA
MMQAQIQEYRRVLEAKATELSSDRHRVDDIEIERDADSMDDVVLANERELAMDAIHRDALVLQQVFDALRRIRFGDYGRCTECDRPIAPKRLAVVPWAPLCLMCQDAADRRNGTDRLHHGALFSSVA